jgi:D-glycerate 3-kinase
MAVISDDAMGRVLKCLLPQINEYLECRSSRKDILGPFILGITGTQGSGKSTWARAILSVLTSTYHFNVIALSLDDLYFDHANLIRIRESSQNNGLLQTRGHPGTHDEQLADEFFGSLRTGSTEVLIPSFDKSKFDGEGDRVPKDQWKSIPGNPPLDVLIFEGWCLGFQPLSDAEMEEKWQLAKRLHQEAVESSEPEQNPGYSTTTLAKHSLDHLRIINKNLRRYCETFTGPSNFDYFIHLDADKLVNVYEWRIEQEHALKREKGVGMTDEQVIRFVQGYMPGYELYLDRLRREPFVRNSPEAKWKGNLRVVLNKKRDIIEMKEL